MSGTLASLPSLLRGSRDGTSKTFSPGAPPSLLVRAFFARTVAFVARRLSATRPNQALDRTALRVSVRLLANSFAVAQFGSLGAYARSRS